MLLKIAWEFAGWKHRMESLSRDNSLSERRTTKHDPQDDNQNWQVVAPYHYFSRFLEYCSHSLGKIRLPGKNAKVFCHLLFCFRMLSWQNLRRSLLSSRSTCDTLSLRQVSNFLGHASPVTVLLLTVLHHQSFATRQDSGTVFLIVYMHRVIDKWVINFEVWRADHEQR